MKQGLEGGGTAAGAPQQWGGRRAGAVSRAAARALAWATANAAFMRLLLFFFAAYWQQGIAGVWSGSIQPGYIRSFGIRYAGSGDINTVRMLPWWGKVLIALPQDRFSLLGLGHRLPYAFLGLALGLATLAVFPYINPVAEKDLFLLNTFLCALGVATADAAADGMAVDHATAEHGALVQGVMSAGSTAGALLGGAVTGALLGSHGRNAAVWWLVAAFALSLPPVFLTREQRPPERGGGPLRTRDVLAALWRSVRQQRFIALATFIVLGALGNAIASQPLDIHLPMKFDIADDEFAYMQTTAALAGLLGAVVVAAVFDRVEKKFVLAFEGVFYVVVNYMPLVLRSKADVQAFWLCNAFLGQVHFVATSRLMVLYAERYAGATFFALTASVSNFSTLAGTALGGALAERWGPDVAYILGSTVNAFMLLPILWLTDTAPLGRGGSVSGLHGAPPPPALGEGEQGGGGGKAEAPAGGAAAFPAPSADPWVEAGHAAAAGGGGSGKGATLAPGVAVTNPLAAGLQATREQQQQQQQQQPYHHHHITAHHEAVLVPHARPGGVAVSVVADHVTYVDDADVGEADAEGQPLPAVTEAPGGVAVAPPPPAVTARQLRVQAAMGAAPASAATTTAAAQMHSGRFSASST